MIQLNSITASTAERLSKISYKSCRITRGCIRGRIECAQVECADVCGCSFLCLYVLYPQARDRCMPLAAMPTSKVRGALFPRVNSATALSVILLSSFIIKSQVLRLEPCCPDTSAFFSLRVALAPLRGAAAFIIPKPSFVNPVTDKSPGKSGRKTGQRLSILVH